jgi:hypothetical protein
MGTPLISRSPIKKMFDIIKRELVSEEGLIVTKYCYFCLVPRDWFLVVRLKL